MNDINEYFNKIKDNPLYNTSYPRDKKDWAKYKVNELDLFSNVKDLCVYIHIPFCKSLCKFCEYTRFKVPSKEIQFKYINTIIHDMRNFKIKGKVIHGIDIGGGTPTALDYDVLNELLLEVYNYFEGIGNTSDDYSKSIEASFSTIDEAKIKLIKSYFYDRISLGYQSSSYKVRESNNMVLMDENRLSEYKETIKTIKSYGMKVNLDIMYGMKNQTIDNIGNTLMDIHTLNPDQVTLYEMRYNMKDEVSSYTKGYLASQYIFMYYTLIGLGYNAKFGENAFSKTDDKGVSSYIRNRMDGMPYVGFGLSAQSMSNKGLSYNYGKNMEEFVLTESYKPEDIYLLPPSEIAAKYISVSLYKGNFSLSILEDILKEDPYKVYEEELYFILQNNYAWIEDKVIYLTPKGFVYYGAVGALFCKYGYEKYLIMNRLSNNK